MKINPEEIESIKNIGELNGAPVKMIRCFGGFYAAVGSRSKNSKSVEPIAAGSHQALVMHQLEKEFKSEFKPALMKSESEKMPYVKEFTKKLPKEMVSAGFELFSLTKNNDINFVATKHGAEVINLSGYIISNEISKLTRVTSIASPQETSKICTAIAEVLNG